MKTFGGLLVSCLAVFLSVFGMTAVDLWRISPFRPQASSSRVRRWMFGERRP